MSALLRPGLDAPVPDAPALPAGGRPVPTAHFSCYQALFEKWPNAGLMQIFLPGKAI